MGSHEVFGVTLSNYLDVKYLVDMSYNLIRKPLVLFRYRTPVLPVAGAKGGRLYFMGCNTSSAM